MRAGETGRREDLFRLLRDDAWMMACLRAVGDRMAMLIRPTPAARRGMGAYRARVAGKNWRRIYPNARIEA